MGWGVSFGGGGFGNGGRVRTSLLDAGCDCFGGTAGSVVGVRGSRGLGSWGSCVSLVSFGILLLGRSVASAIAFGTRLACRRPRRPQKSRSLSGDSYPGGVMGAMGGLTDLPGLGLRLGSGGLEDVVDADFSLSLVVACSSEVLDCDDSDGDGSDARGALVSRTLRREGTS